ncbi:MAG: hypothetical protein ACI9KE_000429 [Polyangiales bacterium]|jgi:uncharacterized protein (DUF342 family)
MLVEEGMLGRIGTPILFRRPESDKSGAQFGSGLEGTKDEADPEVETQAATISGYVTKQGNQYSITPVIVISEDGLSASARFPTKEQPGLEWSFALVEDLLRESNVVFGLDVMQVERFVDFAERSFKSDADSDENPFPPLDEPFELARGKAAMRGARGRVNYFIDVETQTGELGIDDCIDFKKRYLMAPVDEGERIAMRAPPSLGSDGKKVTGELVDAGAGRDAPFTPGQNVRLEPDGKTYVATLTGVAIKRGEKLDVVSKLTISSDVDYETGNLESPTGVEISGSVRSTFRVSAYGDVVIGETLEDAVVEARGDVIVKVGISQGAMGSVTAHGSITTPFVQNAQLRSGATVTIADNCINSLVVAKEGIDVTGGRGRVVGGRLVAGESIKCKVAGSRADVRTILQVGVPYKELAPTEKRMRSVERRMAVATLQVGESFEDLLSIPLRDIPHLGWRKIIERWKKLDQKRLALEKTRETILAKHRTKLADTLAIEITEQIFPNTILMFGTHTKEINQLTPPGVFVWDDEEKTIVKKKLRTPKEVEAAKAAEEIAKAAEDAPDEAPAAETAEPSAEEAVTEDSSNAPSGAISEGAGAER